MQEKLHQALLNGINRDVFQNEDGAIDLASIMVGIIVIGLIVAIIVATIFVVVPWSQDSAAKQQLESLRNAENAYYGLSAATATSLPAGYTPNSFTDSTGLGNANLLQPGKSYCVVATSGGQDFQAFSASGSGSIWTISNGTQSPSVFSGTLPAACQSITASTSPAYVDPTPTITKLTYNCGATGQSLHMLMSGNLVGTETWSDGTSTWKATLNSPTNTGAQGTLMNLAANTTYTVVFDGTYLKLSAEPSTAAQACLKSVDHLGANSGVTRADGAFYSATNLTSVPDHIPSTLTNMQGMFQGATSFNDPNISSWDVSNVTNMNNMFSSASAFNQSLNSWNTSNVTDMGSMFNGAGKFNQPLNKWNTSKVSNMNGMFGSAIYFNQPLNTWDVSHATNMSQMFMNAASFNQPLNNWNVSNVTTMSMMFYGANQFKGDVGSWNVSQVTTVTYMFINSAITQDLHTWHTVSVTSGTKFAPSTYPTAYLPPNTSL